MLKHMKIYENRNRLYQKTGFNFCFASSQTKQNNNLNIILGGTFCHFVLPK